MSSLPKRARSYYHSKEVVGPITGGPFRKARCVKVEVAGYQSEDKTEDGFQVRWLGPQSGEIALLFGDRLVLARALRQAADILETVP